MSPAETDDRKFPPGPPVRARHPLASIGYWLSIARDPVGFVGKRFDTYGDLYHAQAGAEHLYVLRHPEHIHDVLVERATSFRKVEDRGLRFFLGTGLLTSDGELWKRQRRMIQPAFHRRALAAYADTMVAHTLQMLDGWVAGSVRDIGDDMMRLTLRVACKCLFDHEVSTNADVVARTMSQLNQAVGPQVLPDWLPTPARRRRRTARRRMYETIDRMIAVRRGSRTSESVDLLSMLLDAIDGEGDGQEMGHQQLRDELVTLFLAGHETTSHGLTWTWFLLSQNPRVEALLHAEIDRVLARRPPTPDDLAQLVYTRRVVQEALRMYPPAYVIPRRAAEEVAIGGYSISAGSEVLCWIYHTHHDPRWFPDPESFLPERFSPDASPAVAAHAYLPFGAGQRMCIGKSFAELEMALVLATVAQRFRLRVIPGHKVEVRPKVTLTPKYGMRMSLTGRGV